LCRYTKIIIGGRGLNCDQSLFDIKYTYIPGVKNGTFCNKRWSST